MNAVGPVLPVAASDGELLSAVADGNLVALGALFDRHAPELRRYMVRIGVPAVDADDLIQATFLEVVRAARRFDPTQAARGFLFGVAMILVLRHRRSVRRALARLATFASTSTRELVPMPDELAVGEETALRFQRALDGLSAKKRDVFVLVHVEGFSGEEAARALGIPIKTVWTRLHHARRELRAALEEASR